MVSFPPPLRIRVAAVSRVDPPICQHVAGTNRYSRTFAHPTSGLGYQLRSSAAKEAAYHDLFSLPVGMTREYWSISSSVAISFLVVDPKCGRVLRILVGNEAYPLCDSNDAVDYLLPVE